MGFKLQVTNEMTLPDLTGDGRIDLTDVSTSVAMVDAATASAKVLVEREGFFVELTTRFPIIDVNRDGNIDLNDVVRVGSMLSSQQIVTKIVTTKE